MAEICSDISPSSPTIDPITVEVIGSALTSIGEEMGEALIRASYSTNIKERRDCSTALFDVAGNMLCQAEHIPMHLGSFIEMVPTIMERYPLESLRPGDVFVGNDAYVGGSTHLPDVVLAEPVFYEGRPVVWAVNTAHHADFVDRTHAHIYQEGIRIPPVRLYREGVLQQDFLDLILLNCQVPKERISDFGAQMAANRLGVTRVVELCDRYGLDVVLLAGKELQDYAERKMRAGISRIPNGTYKFSDVFESTQLDDNLRISVEISVVDDEMHLTFEAPDQVRSGINMTHTALLSSCYFAVKAVVDPTILPNSGLSRPIKVSAPRGSLINCSHPAPVLGRVNTCMRVVDVILGALAQAVPDHIVAAGNGAVPSITFSGEGPTGDFWVYLETIAGGSGARATKDGLDGVHVHMSNTSNLPLEALEVEYPLTVLRYELVNGSGGAGRHRGGMGLRRVYRAERECRVEINASRVQTSPWGLFGGLAGGRFSSAASDGVSNLAKNGGLLSPGDEITITTSGAGGYGSPAERSIALVEKDIREGVIDLSLAHIVYPHAFGNK